MQHHEGFAALERGKDSLSVKQGSEEKAGWVHPNTLARWLGNGLVWFQILKQFFALNLEEQRRKKKKKKPESKQSFISKVSKQSNAAWISTCLPTGNMHPAVTILAN